MPRSKTEPMPDRLKELKAQAQAAEEALQGHRERMEALQTELDKAESALRLKDVELTEQVEDLLKNLPASGASERVVAELQKFKQSGRAELNEQVITFQTALRAEAALARKAEAEVKEIGKQIAEEHFDQAARELHAELSDFVERFKVANGKRARLFELARTCGFGNFCERFKRLGLRYALSYGVLCESHLSKRNPDTMNVFQIAEQLESIGQAYNEKPLQLPGQPNAADNIPRIRERVHGYSGFVMKN